MPIRSVDPEKIRIVQDYLQQELPGYGIHSFPDQAWQTYVLKFDDTSGRQCVCVTLQFFRDVPEISATLRAWRLGDRVYNAKPKSLLVTSTEIREHEYTLK